MSHAGTRELSPDPLTAGAPAPSPPPPTPSAPPSPTPLPVLPLEYAPAASADARTRTWRRITLVCLEVAGATCVVGLAAIAYQTESVIVTGPILFTLGVLALVGGLFTRDRLAAALGASHCFICLLFVFLVNALRWSPDEAHLPFLVMGTVFTLAVIYPTALVYLHTRDHRAPV